MISRCDRELPYGAQFSIGEKKEILSTLSDKQELSLKYKLHRNYEDG